jgi:dinuclear metal center YbgI/SA1388 family protein
MGSMQVREITDYIESFAPLSYQESYDNAGLQTGQPDHEVNAVLLCIDVTDAVIEEALRLEAGLIISHHPLIFGGLKKLTGSNPTEKMVIRAIRNDISIYTAHTNLDAVHTGVNHKICEKLALQETRVLVPMTDQLRKLVFFVPRDHAEQVRLEIFREGAGHIGNYDMCSFSAPGEGTFRGLEGSDPFVGEKGSMHMEPELRVETIFPKAKEKSILQALIRSHPYEEVAYDVYPLANTYDQAGSGAIGRLAEPAEEQSFLQLLKDQFRTPVVRHSMLLGKKIRNVALCGGSGSFLIHEAMASGADAFVSSDFKYHQFFNADGRILLADIGHYESEQFTIEIFYEYLIKKFPTFAVHLSEVNTNPVNYF